MKVKITKNITNNRFKILVFSNILGIISSFSLPPYNLFFLNFIVFPLLFSLTILLKNHKKYLFFHGLFFGFGYFCSSLYWISNSLKYEDTLRFLIPITIILIPLVISFFYALAFILLSFFKLKYNYSSILIFALFLSLFEYLRGSVFTGFPWNLVVFSIAEFTYSLQLLSIVGTYSLNLLVVSLFLSPTILFFDVNLKLKFIIIFYILLLVIINNIYGIKKVENFKKLKNEDLKFKISIVSPKIELERYFSNEKTSRILDDLIKISNPNKNVETLFIFPEGILSGITFNDLQNYKNLFYESFSKKHKIILGINSEDKFKIFNSLILADNRLRIISQYDKNKLVPFGEYLPFEDKLSKIGLKKVTQGYNSFSPSNERNLIKIGNYNFLPLICYEIIYSGKLNNNKKKIDYIINISEDGWFGNSIGPSQHFVHSIFRSIEEGKNIFRSSNNGISAHINPLGFIEKSIESTQSGVIEVKNIKLISTTLFAREGNKIFFYFIVIYITFIFFLKRKDL